MYVLCVVYISCQIGYIAKSTRAKYVLARAHRVCVCLVLVSANKHFFLTFKVLGLFNAIDNMSFIFFLYPNRVLLLGQGEGNHAHACKMGPDDDV